MKKVLFLSLAMIFATSMFAQKAINKNAKITSSVKQSTEIQKKAISNVGNYVPGENFSSSFVGRGNSAEDPKLVKTLYDLQSNAIPTNRIYRMEDGTMMFTSTIAEDGGFANRGSAYNHFDGTQWNPTVELRNVEPIRSGWPTIVPYEDGAVLFSHSATAIQWYKTESRTNPTWESMGELPESGSFAWPKTSVTVDDGGNTIIHVVASNQGDEATIMRYWRSADGGNTWEGPSQIAGFEDGTAHARYITDNMTVCTNGTGTIVVLFIDVAANVGYSRSDDNGQTWTYHSIYQNFFEENFYYISNFVPGDTLQMWTVASGMGALDNSGKLHIVFNICCVARDSETEPGYYSYYYGAGIDGVGYWNEDMGEITRDPNFVNNIGQGRMTVDSTFHMIKMDESDHIKVVGAIGGSWYGIFEEGAENWPIFGDTYASDKIYNYKQSLGCSIFPAISADNNGRVIIAFSTFTKEGTLSSDAPLYLRKIFTREYDPTLGWQEETTSVNSGFLYTYNEVIYPMFPQGDISDAKWHVFFNSDSEVGLVLNTGETGQSQPTDNFIQYQSWVKHGVTAIEDDNNTTYHFSVYPNPASKSVIVELEENSTVQIYNAVGQLVSTFNGVQGKTTVDISNYTQGVYLVSVRNAQGATSTQKLIVR